MKWVNHQVKVKEDMIQWFGGTVICQGLVDYTDEHRTLKEKGQCNLLGYTDLEGLPKPCCVFEGHRKFAPLSILLEICLTEQFQFSDLVYLLSSLTCISVHNLGL